MSAHKIDGLGDQRDRFYSCLLRAHEGLDEAQSHALNARLVLLLANAMQDTPAAIEVIEQARAYEGVATETR